MKTFDPTLRTDRDWVRLTIGDAYSPTTVAAKAYFEDESIDAFLAEEPNKWYAAARLAEILMASWMAKGAGVIEKQVDMLHIRRQGAQGQTAESDYRSHIHDLREEGQRRGLAIPRTISLL